jgi:uncharacterized protein (TIGR02246 family)
MTHCSRSRFGLPIVAALALLVPSLAGAQGIEAPRVAVRTAVREINALRAEYAAGMSDKNVDALTAVYADDAIVIQPDGNVVVGRKAIGESLAQQAPTWTKTTIVSDSLRVFGNTAVDVGTMHGEDGANASHYLVVLRRGVKVWKVNSVAIVADRPATTKE